MTLAARSPYEDGPGDRSSSLNFGIGDVLADLGWSRAIPVPAARRRYGHRTGLFAVWADEIGWADLQLPGRAKQSPLFVGETATGRAPALALALGVDGVGRSRLQARLTGLLGDRIVSSTLRGSSSAALDQVAARRLLKWMETRLTVAFWAGEPHGDPLGLLQECVIAWWSPAPPLNVEHQEDQRSAVALRVRRAEARGRRVSSREPGAAAS